jgi:hypothetical protein
MHFGENIFSFILATKKYWTVSRAVRFILASSQRPHILLGKSCGTP